MDSNTKVNVQPCEATSTAADDSYREGFVINLLFIVLNKYRNV